MKSIIRICIVLLLAAGMLLTPVFAAPEDEVQTNPEVQTDEQAPTPDEQMPAPNEQTPAPNEQTPAPNEQTPAPDNKVPETPQTPPAQTPAPAKTNKIVVGEENAAESRYVYISDNFAAEFVGNFSGEYPVTIDLTAYDKVDYVVLPKVLYDVIATDPAAEEQTTDEADEPAVVDETAVAEADETAVNEVDDNVAPAVADLQAQQSQQAQSASAAAPASEPAVLKIILKDKECVWKRSDLGAIDDSETSVTLSTENAPEKTRIPVPEKGTSVAFKPEKDKATGILFVEKNDKGVWNVTSNYLFGSGFAYVIAIVILVSITLAVILAVNLIIIKLYKAKK